MPKIETYAGAQLHLPAHTGADGTEYPAQTIREWDLKYSAKRPFKASFYIEVPASYFHDGAGAFAGGQSVTASLYKDENGDPMVWRTWHRGSHIYAVVDDTLEGLKDCFKKFCRAFNEDATTEEPVILVFYESEKVGLSFRTERGRMRLIFHRCTKISRGSTCTYSPRFRDAWESEIGRSIHELPATPENVLFADEIEKAYANLQARLDSVFSSRDDLISAIQKGFWLMPATSNRANGEKEKVYPGGDRQEE